MREWNPLVIDDASTSPSFSDAAATSTQPPRGSKRASPRQKRAEAVADRPNLPGFVNAFDSLSPRPASQSARAQEKQREGAMTAEEAERNFFAPSEPSPRHARSLRLFQSPPSSPLGQKLARRNSRHSPQRASPRRAPQSPVQTQLYDIDMPDSQEDPEEEVEGEFEEVDWAAEVWLRLCCVGRGC